MSSLRRLVHAHVAVVAILIALTLAMRIIVPAGFMPSLSSGTLTITVCTGTSHETMELAIAGMKKGDAGQHEKQSRCAFADLALPWLSAVDPIQLAAAITFIMAMAFFVTPALRLVRARRAWPPLRGPPLTA
ncbi:MAG: DUF2946 family protein [Sphingomonas sp.]|uniref:hypothetical protein n=1 Tax=Sphingomonas sp. TaxID=28214 RepID=UPI00356A2C2E